MFRRRLMAQHPKHPKHPKHLAVLNAAAEHAGWGKPLGELKLRRMVLKLNCGHAVNPGRCGARLTKPGLFRPSWYPPRSACCAGG